MQVNIKTLEALDALEISPSEYSVVSDKEVSFDAQNITSFKILNVYLRFKNKSVYRRNLNVFLSVQLSGTGVLCYTHILLKFYLLFTTTKILFTI